MNTFVISSGESIGNESYDFVTVSHPTFTREQFINHYNQVVDGNKFRDCEDVARELVSAFGYTFQEPTVQISRTSVYFGKIVDDSDIYEARVFPGIASAKHDVIAP